MKIALSAGLGRLHFFTTAQALCRSGVNVCLICGWIPRKVNSIFIWVLSRIVGYDLRSGFEKRQIKTDGLDVCPCALSDFFDKILILVFRRILLRFGIDPIWGWKLFGLQSRKHIKGCDIFHVRSGAGHGGAMTLARSLGIPIVVDHSIAHPAFMDANLKNEYERMSVPFDLGMDSKFWKMVIEDCQSADILLVNSHFVRDTFIDQGYPSDKIRVVYLGVPESFLNINSFEKDYSRRRNWQLLFTGAFGFRKGGEYILEAMKILRRNSQFNVELKCVGSTSQGESLIAKYKNDNLPVVFTGPKPQEMLRKYMKEADIYVFPSLAEGCAKSGMEAMAAGMCVVSTHESGLPIVDGENGYLVQSKNAIALAERIEWLMQHPNNITRVGKAAAQFIRYNYSDDDYTRNLRKIYSELLEAKK